MTELSAQFRRSLVSIAPLLFFQRCYSYLLHISLVWHWFGNISMTLSAWLCKISYSISFSVTYTCAGFGESNSCCLTDCLFDAVFFSVIINDFLLGWPNQISFQRGVDNHFVPPLPKGNKDILYHFFRCLFILGLNDIFQTAFLNTYQTAFVKSAALSGNMCVYSL